MVFVVCVIGASFGGLCLVRRLQSSLHAHSYVNDSVRIVVIEPRDYWEYSPGMVHVMCGSGRDAELIRPLNDVLKVGQVGNVCTVCIRGLCIGWDESKKTVHFTKFPYDSGSAKALDTVSYDVCVFASGVPYTSEFKSVSVYSLGDRLYQVSRVKANLLRTIQQAKSTVVNVSSPTLSNKSRTIVIYGGGLIGVELAAELAYRHGQQKKRDNGTKSLSSPLRIIVISRSACLSTMPPPASDLATKWLTSQGVFILTDTIAKCNRVGFTPQKDDEEEEAYYEIHTGRGSTIIAQVFVNCTGHELAVGSLTDANPQISATATADLASSSTSFKQFVWKDGFLVDEGMQVQHKDSLFAIGDCALINSTTSTDLKQQKDDGKPGAYYFSTPHVHSGFLAECQADVCAHNIMLQIPSSSAKSSGTMEWATFPKTEFGVPQIPLVAVVSLGPRNAIFITDSLVLGGGGGVVGFIFAMFKMVIEFSKIEEIRGALWARWFWRVGHLATKHIHWYYCWQHSRQCARSSSSGSKGQQPQQELPKHEYGRIVFVPAILIVVCWVFGCTANFAAIFLSSRGVMTLKAQLLIVVNMLFGVASTIMALYWMWRRL